MMLTLVGNLFKSCMRCSAAIYYLTLVTCV